MNKTTNVFSRIFGSLILIFITFMYMTTNNFALVGLISTVVFGIIAYREHYLVVALDALLVLLCIIIYNISNVYVDLLYVIIDFLSLCLTGIVIGIMLKNKQKHFNTIVAASVSDVLKLLLSLLTIRREGFDIFETLIEKPAKMYSDYAVEILGQSSAYSGENAGVITDLIDSVVMSISTLMPAIIIIISVVTSYFSYVLVKKFIELKTKEKLYVQSFSQLKMKPKVGVALLVFTVLSTIIPQSIVSDAIINIVVIFLFAYFVCGLSVVDFYFKKSHVWWWGRLIIYVILVVLLSMFISAVPLIFVLLAMIDARKDIRGIDIPDIVVEIKDDENES